MRRPRRLQRASRAFKQGLERTLYGPGPPRCRSQMRWANRETRRRQSRRGWGPLSGGRVEQGKRRGRVPRVPCGGNQRRAHGASRRRECNRAPPMPLCPGRRRRRCCALSLLSVPDHATAPPCTLCSSPPLLRALSPICARPRNLATSHPLFDGMLRSPRAWNTWRAEQDRPGSTSSRTRGAGPECWDRSYRRGVGAFGQRVCVCARATPCGPVCCGFLPATFAKPVKD